MTTLREAKEKVREISLKGIEIAENPKLDAGRKRAALTKLEAEMKPWLDEVANLEFVEQARSKAFGGHADGFAAMSSSPSGRPPSEYAMKHSLTGGGDYRLGAVPSLSLADEQLEEMHDALVHRKGFRTQLGLKTAVTSADVPQSTFPQRIDPAIPVRREPNRIANLIPAVASSSPVVEFFVQAQRATAGVVAEGGAKPGSVVDAPSQTATAAKIAGFVDVTDETLKDFAGFRQFVDYDLQAAVIDAENTELLSGSGTSPHNIVGLLNTSGILTRAYPGTPPTNWTQLDTLDQAINDLRTGASYTEPTAWVMSPTTYSSIRREKTTQGVYLLNPDPTAEERQQLWGVPVLLTTQIADGTVLGGNFAEAARIFVRDSLSIIADPFTQMKNNITTVLAEERLGMFVVRPKSLITVTGLPVT